MGESRQRDKMPTTYVRRIDYKPVEAVHYTGDNLAEVCALVGAGYRAAQPEPCRLALLFSVFIDTEHTVRASPDAAPS